MRIVSIAVGPEPDTVCVCGGLLQLVAGKWRHRDPAGTCAEYTSAAPEAVQCWHGTCRQPVAPPTAGRCAYPPPPDPDGQPRLPVPATCCLCCWVTG